MVMLSLKSHNVSDLFTLLVGVGQINLRTKQVKVAGLRPRSTADSFRATKESAEKGTWPPCLLLPVAKAGSLHLVADLRSGKNSGFALKHFPF